MSIKAFYETNKRDHKSEHKAPDIKDPLWQFTESLRKIILHQRIFKDNSHDPLNFLIFLVKTLSTGHIFLSICIIRQNYFAFSAFGSAEKGSRPNVRAAA